MGRVFGDDIVDREQAIGVVQNAGEKKNQDK